MKLYWGPHTCAIGIHILLEEAGARYETEKIDVAGGSTEKPEFMAINPKGKVPVLVRDDGTMLTEFGSIATWIGRRYPEAGLLPQDPEAEARMIEVLEYVEGTLHGQGFGRIFKPARFEPQDLVHQTLGAGQESVKAQGRKMVETALSILDRQIAGRRWAAGEAYSIADAALFYAARWAPQTGIKLPANIQAHFAAMLARPAVQKVRQIWGEA